MNDLGLRLKLTLQYYIVYTMINFYFSAVSADCN